MRSKILRKRHESFVKSPADPGKRHTSWGKILYLLAITALTGYLLQWSYEHFMFVTGLGFLEAETTYVEARTPGRILKFACQINDTVKVGQPLVILGQTQSATLIGSNGGPHTEQERRIITAESKIKQLRKEINYKRDEIRKLGREQRRGKKLIAINVITYPELMSIEEKLKTARYEFSILNIQFDAAVKMLKSYKERYNVNNGSGMITGVTGERVLYAQEDGIISSIFKERGEVARIGEPVIKIMNQKKIFIRAYFAGSYENFLAKGDKVKVIFANGEKSDGIIRDIHPTAHAEPDEIQKHFGVTDRHLVAEIVPANNETWHRVLETKVKILLPRKWI